MADSDKPQTETNTSSDSTAAKTSTAKPPAVVDDDDSDPDFDDLDDVLDQFSANAPSQPKPPAAQSPTQPTPVTSGPGRPSSAIPAPVVQDEAPTPSAQRPDESESDFIERLSKEMSAMFETLSADPSKNMQSPEDIAKMGKELEDFTHKMEEQGIQPEDLLKAILGEAEGEKIANLALAEKDRLENSPLPSSSSQPPAQATASTPKSPQPAAAVPASPSTSKSQPKSFEDTIRNTMSRLGESDKSATTAAQKSTTQKSEEDLLADMLRALDAGPGGAAGDPSSDEGLSKMFMDMMQQLTHKDLLYEPMKELHTQYPSWLEAHQNKIDPSEFQRYTRQSVIVGEITQKFEEPGFNDDDPACRDFIWERMQKMQDEGAPPEELVKNPFPGTEFGGGIPGLGGGGADQLPEGLGKELEEGCPTQ